MRKLNYLLFLVLLLELSGCALTVIGAGVGTAVATASDTRGGGTVIDDQKLESKINSNLGNHAPEGSYTVAAYDGVVLFAGQVQTDAQYAKATSAVINTQGVKKVRNYLTVGKKESLSDVSKDTYITSVAKSRHIAQKDVNANNIKVVTCAGVVYILGRNAGSSYQIKAAID